MIINFQMVQQFTANDEVSERNDEWYATHTRLFHRVRDRINRKNEKEI